MVGFVVGVGVVVQEYGGFVGWVVVVFLVDVVVVVGVEVVVGVGFDWWVYRQVLGEGGYEVDEVWICVWMVWYGLDCCVVKFVVWVLDWLLLDKVCYYVYLLCWMLVCCGVCCW